MIKILDNCRGALDEIDGVVTRVLRPGLSAAVVSLILGVQKDLDRITSGKDEASADLIDDALSTLAEISDLPEFNEFARREIYGVSVEARFNDVVWALKILSEYLKSQRRIASGDNAGNRVNVDEIARSSEFQIGAERIVKTLSQGAFAFHDGPREGSLEARLQGFDYQLDRASELAEQLILAGPDTRSGATLLLFESLQHVRAEFGEFLTNERKRTGNFVLKAFEQSKRLLLDFGMYTEAEEVITTPPEQALAPFQFRITGDRLTLQPQEANPKAGSAAIANAALRVLTGLAEDIDEDLANSNHPRLFRAFARLRDGLNSDASIVEIGMLCASFEGQVGAAADELSDSLVALLASFTKGVTDYASQFEEWQNFSDNSAEANFAPEDAENYAKVARVLATELERRQEVDNRVPEALRQVADWNDSTSTPRSRLSVGRTVLNIIAVCYTELVTKPVKIVVSGVGLATGAAALAIVLNHAALYATEMAKSPEGAWLRPAVRVIENYIGKLEKP